MQGRIWSKLRLQEGFSAAGKEGQPKQNSVPTKQTLEAQNDIWDSRSGGKLESRGRVLLFERGGGGSGGVIRGMTYKRRKEKGKGEA